MANNSTSPDQRDRESEPSLAEQLREFTKEVSDLKDAGGKALTDTFAHWLTAYLVAAAKTAACKAGAEGLDLKTLRGLIADAVALRRGDHSAQRLIIEREQLQLNRELSKERMEKLFWEWAKKPENKARICDSGLSADEKARRIREIFGLEPAETEEPTRGVSKETIRSIQEQTGLL